jgi:hypothetical protein
MTWLNPGRWLALLAVVVALIAGAKYAVHKAEQRGYDRAMSDIAKVAEKAAIEARETEQANAKRQKEAQDAQTKRNQTLQTVLADVRRERDSLRDDLDTLGRALSQDSGAACTQYATTLGGLLNQCAADLEGLAGKAQGHVNDIKLMVESWPKSQ